MSGRFVHCNGRVVPADEARVSPLDAGFLYGDGIYETMRAYGGRVFALGRHFARLHRSAAGVALQVPPDADLRRAIEQAVAANEVADAAVRLTITRGRLARRLDLSSAGAPSVLVTVDPVDPADDARRARGIRVVYSRYRRFSQHPLAGIKSTNYQVSLFARNEAREAGADEVLLANETGDIVEAAAANVSIVERGRVVTPPLDSGILGGVTREVALEVARARGIPVIEETFSRARLEAADEVFVSGTTIQVAPVVALGDRAVGGGRPGPVTT
ncbi:MAG: aminotransferase class IV, partial [Candidatus Eiseniibacteriota bacterium]